MATYQRKGEALKSQAREVIARVIARCDQEARNNAFAIPVTAKTSRAAFYTGVSERTISKIRKENEIRNLQAPYTPLKSPGRRRHKLGINEKIDDFDFHIIRHAVGDFYVRLKVAPTLLSLLSAIREKISFPYGIATLRRLVKKRGFTWRIYNKRKILIEHPTVIQWRFQYLQAIRQYQGEDRNIFYLDAVWVSNSMTVQKCRHSSVIPAEGCLIVAHAASFKGFVENAESILETGTSTGRMNKDSFEKWLQEQIFPIIPPASVIVMNSTYFNSELQNYVPTKYSTKSAMIAWLEKSGIKYDPLDRKGDLITLIESNKPKETIYKIDELIRKEGHIPLRIPPYLCELNPIEYAWSDIKNYIKERNLSGKPSTDKLKGLMCEAMASITEDNWERYTKQIIKMQTHYWERDGIVENAIDEIITSLGEDSEEDNNDSTSGSSSEEDNMEMDEVDPLE